MCWWMFKKLPIWAYGLECEICEKTFINPESHYKEVQELGTEKAHEGKIPLLRKD